MGAFFAVAEEEVAAARGAQIADEDVWGAQAGAEELSAIGFAEVEQDILGRALVARGHHIHPLNRIGLVTGAEFVEPFGGFGKLRLELGGNFGADFVAAAADRRADGGEEAAGLGAELHLHLADGFDDDALQRAAPAGMDGSDGAFFRIDEENGDTVGGLHTEKETGAVGDRSVARHGGQATPRLGGLGVEKMDDIGMDLFQRDELDLGCGKGGLETAAVFKDVFSIVPFGEAEIQNLFAALVGNAAGACAEAVDKPGEFC